MDDYAQLAPVEGCSHQAKYTEPDNVPDKKKLMSV